MKSAHLQMPTRNRLNLIISPFPKWRFLHPPTAPAGEADGPSSDSSTPRNTKFPAHRPTPAFAFGLFSPSSRACSLSHLAGWVNHRTSPPLRRILQPPRKLERRVHGHGVGIRGTAAQRASCTHPAVPGAELCLWNGHTQSD